jgi:1-acyl-sn-glycerol-3-phosphate acyltransferase
MKIFYTSFPVRIVFESVFMITFILQSVVYRLLFAYRVSGRHHLKDIDHAILVSNHNHYLDPGFAASAVWPRRCYFSGLEQTFRTNRIFSFFIRALGGFPIPENTPGEVVRPIGRILSRTRRFIHFFPEGRLHPYQEQLLDFQEGAFSLACFFQVPVIPVVITQKKHRLWPFTAIRVFIEKPCICDESLGKKEAVRQLSQTTAQLMRQRLHKT